MIKAWLDFAHLTQADEGLFDPLFTLAIIYYVLAFV